MGKSQIKQHERFITYSDLHIIFCTGNGLQSWEFSPEHCWEYKPTACYRMRRAGLLVGCKILWIVVNHVSVSNHFNVATWYQVDILPKRKRSMCIINTEADDVLFVGDSDRYRLSES